VLQKGTSAYWLYSKAPRIAGGQKARAARNAKVARLRKGKAGPDLMTELRRVKGLDILGAPSVSVTLEDREARIKQEAKAKASRSGRFLRNYDLTVYRYAAVKVAEISISLWGMVDRASTMGQTLAGPRRRSTPRRRNFANIESEMAAKGAITQKARDKLVSRSRGRWGTGARRPHRPLIQPFIQYYATVKIPNMVRAVTQAKFGGITAGNYPTRAPRK
jgi:hypothetical protein